MITNSALTYLEIDRDEGKVENEGDGEMKKEENKESEQYEFTVNFSWGQKTVEEQNKTKL